MPVLFQHRMLFSFFQDDCPAGGPSGLRFIAFLAGHMAGSVDTWGRGETTGFYNDGLAAHVMLHGFLLSTNVHVL